MSEYEGVLEVVGKRSVGSGAGVVFDLEDQGGDPAKLLVTRHDSGSGAETVAILWTDFDRRDRNGYPNFNLGFVIRRDEDGLYYDDVHTLVANKANDHRRIDLSERGEALTPDVEWLVTQAEQELV